MRDLRALHASLGEITLLFKVEIGVAAERLSKEIAKLGNESFAARVPDNKETYK